jgi:fucose 4-O-acetylase-like acetyltransferase
MIDRDLNLDYVKGSLVLIMVIYHAMNYFSKAHPSDYSYIRFVTGAFIFISGYIVSTYYEKKYNTVAKEVCKRLIIRGVKLIILFTILNLSINVFQIGSYKNISFSIQNYIDHISDIYIWGNSKYAAFKILLPISYVLIISPIYIIQSSWKKYMVVATLILVILMSTFNIDSYNIGLALVGLVGLSAGMYTNVSKSYFIENEYVILGLVALSMLFMKYADTNVLTYSVSIMIILKLLYDYAKTMSMDRPIFRTIILFGQYPLLCYVMQIAILQGLYRLLPKNRWGFGYEIIAIILCTTVLLYSTCYLTDHYRTKYKLVDAQYKFIFS